jgi:hypothetical protein
MNRRLAMRATLMEIVLTHEVQFAGASCGACLHVLQHHDDVLDNALRFGHGIAVGVVASHLAKVTFPSSLSAALVPSLGIATCIPGTHRTSVQRKQPCRESLFLGAGSIGSELTRKVGGKDETRFVVSPAKVVEALLDNGGLARLWEFDTARVKRGFEDAFTASGANVSSLSGPFLPCLHSTNCMCKLLSRCSVVPLQSAGSNPTFSKIVGAHMRAEAVLPVAHAYRYRLQLGCRCPSEIVSAQPCASVTAAIVPQVRHWKSELRSALQ